MPFIGNTAAPFVSPLSFDSALSQLTGKGWTVVSEGPSGAQMKKPKEMRTADKWCIGLGIVGLFAMGLGVILILIGVLDYAFFTKERTHFLSRENPRLP